MQGNIQTQKKDQQAEQFKQRKFEKECTFAPATNKGNLYKKALNNPSQIDGRVSVGSINLDGVAKKKDKKEEEGSFFGFLRGNSKEPKDKFQPPAKYDQLYSMRKRQLDKQDKTKEDYEFEKQEQECTFAPKLMTKNPKYIRDRLNQKQSQDISSTPQHKQAVHDAPPQN